MPSIIGSGPTLVSYLLEGGPEGEKVVALVKWPPVNKKVVILSIDVFGVRAVAAERIAVVQTSLVCAPFYLKACARDARHFKGRHLYERPTF